MRAFGLMVALAALVYSGGASALMLDDEGRVHLHGYVGQGLVYSPDNPFGGFESKARPSLDYREVGLNLSVLLNEQARLTVQGRSRKVAKVCDGTPELEILSLNAALLSAPWGMVELRVGRNRNNLIGFYSAQDAPSSHPGVVLPLNYVLLPPALLSMDGLALDGSWLGERGDVVSWTLYGGRRQDLTSRSMEWHTYGRDVPGDYARAGLWGVRLMWQPAGLSGTEVGFSVARAELGFDSPVPGASWDSTGWGWNGLFRQRWGRWQLSVDVMRVNNDRLRADQPRGFYDLGYVELVWEMDGRTSLVGRHSWYEAQKNPLRNSPWIHTSESWTLGVRRYLSARWHVAAQASSVRGTAMVPAFEGYEREPLRKYWMLYMMELTFEF